ncbi:MAG: APC family permease [Steroidobacteraceae bacterium]|jgi:amino acid transporter|nr:APC family permease [Steroidobacteraceae bacterium]
MPAADQGPAPGGRRDLDPSAGAAVERSATPAATLGTLDGIAFVVGIVVGIGIFRTPQVVAANAASGTAFMLLWLLGAALMLVGALCYAELGASRPHAGGEYHFLARAWGQPVATLFAWARGTVIQTGAIATVAFVYGDYATQLLPLGARGAALHAGLAILAVTAVNVRGTRPGSRFQSTLTVLTLLALAAVALAGFLVEPAAGEAARSAGTLPAGTLPAAAEAGAPRPEPSAGLALIFVLLTYGGWNEAAYLSGELRDPRRAMWRVLLFGTGAVAVAYLVVNLAYLRALGLEGASRSEVVAADLMRLAAGDAGARLISLFVAFAALSTLNATVFTGARVYYALGQDVPALRRFGTWSTRGETPTNALWLQAAIALALVAFGSLTRDGFTATVEYTAPVFWFFLLLVALSLFVFRWREPGRELPFRVPLYPLTPALFVATCAYMLWSSLAYTGRGALLGVAVLALGLPLLWHARRGRRAVS